MEKLQTMLQYNEVHTNLVFKNIPTIPLELYAEIELKGFNDCNENNEQFPTNSVNFICIVDKARKYLNLPDSRQIRKKNKISLKDPIKHLFQLTKHQVFLFIHQNCNI